MQRTRRHAIHVDLVVHDAHAQPVEVEMGVACLERIERPVHPRDAALRQLHTLLELETPADAHLAGEFGHAEHVRPPEALCH